MALITEKVKMREEFEAWWEGESGNRLYCESAWRGWQASCAAPVVQGEPVYFWREIGETDWMECRKDWYWKCVNSPEHDTKLLYTTPQPAEQQPAPHPDDAAVDRFAAAMKAKLNKKRQEGRGGWQSMTAEQLSALLHEHVRKGDPVDVGNLAMMLHQNGQGIKHRPLHPSYLLQPKRRCMSNKSWMLEYMRSLGLLESQNDTQEPRLRGRTADCVILDDYLTNTE